MFYFHDVQFLLVCLFDWGYTKMHFLESRNLNVFALAASLQDRVNHIEYHPGGDRRSLIEYM